MFIAVERSETEHILDKSPSLEGFSMQLVYNVFTLAWSNLPFRFWSAGRFSYQPASLALSDAVQSCMREVFSSNPRPAGSSQE